MSSIAGVLAALEESRTLRPQVAASLTLPAAPEIFALEPPALDARLLSALRSQGIERLWTHQAAGLGAVQAGRDVLITTPTASGKSLVFHLPVLDAALRREEGNALFLYPLKALGQDQRQKLLGLAGLAGLDAGARLAAVYDGDTPSAERARIKRSFPRVVISNPDMLHLGVLGSWQAWEPFLRRLRWIVLDELHVYRGIFGSHFHHVLQRLLRLCRTLGSDPVVIASSATAANAGEFASRLLGRSCEWISESGAPRSARHLLLLRPVASPYTLTLALLAFLLERGLKTIVFTKARRITELLVAWLGRQHPSLAERVRGYRSGFLPGERREIERALATGRLDGVIATSALELGIDIGGLDACVLVGFPGSVMATWQRSGRVGRGDRESITALVALPDALDQFFLDHPEALVDRPLEQLIIDPTNESVARPHLVCAAAEKPLSTAGDAEYVRELRPVVDELAREGLLEQRGTEEWRAAVARPHRQVRLRGIGEPSVICDPRGRVIGTVDGVRVLTECHPGAIYLHQGCQYLVRELDLGRRRIVAEPLSVDYYTAPLTEKETAILDVVEESSHRGLRACLGRLRVTEKVIGYERRKVRSQEAVDRQELDLPAVSYETQGLWWIAPQEVEDRLRSEGVHFMGALHAAEHAAISLVPLFALCDRGDIGGISIPVHPQLDCGAVFIYDGHSGGAGIARRAFADLQRLLERVRSLVASCGCETGCPSCIQSPKCGNGNRPLDKEGAVRLLAAILGDAPAGARSALPLREYPAPSEGRVGAREESADPVAEGGSVGPGEQEPRTMILAWETTVPGSGSGLAGAAVHHLEVGRTEVFDESATMQLVTLLDSARLVVGWQLGAACEVLTTHAGRAVGDAWKRLDLAEEARSGASAGVEISDILAAIADEREGDGESGRREDAVERCRRRAEELGRIYTYGRKRKHLPVRLAGGGESRLPVDW